MNKNKLKLIFIFVVMLVLLTSCKINTEPTNPEITNNPTVTVEPTKPVETPASPVETITPIVTPTLPETTVTPTNPVVTPTQPVEPTAPVTPTIPSIEKYTVTWKNYDGKILETDTDVEKGTTPTYDGETPVKPNNNSTYYTFNGWTPSITEVIADVTYTATFTEQTINNNIAGSIPVLSQDGKTITYGLYPQTHVKDSALISILDTLEPKENGWYLYENNYYCKEVATVYNNESYTFNDGTAIINGTAYWFKCEPISWNVLNNTDGKYYLVSTYLLDTQQFYNNYNNRVIEENIIYPNNYEQSDIRSWLNGYFYNKAFSLSDYHLLETTVDNSASTTDNNNNKYFSNNTLDKVLLPTYQDYINELYNFDSTTSVTKTRECKTTDYARARGAWVNETSALKNNGTYWTRSSTSEYYFCAWNVNSAGFLSTYAVDGTSHCVRPSIYINIE